MDPDWHYAMIYEGYWRPYDHTGDPLYYGHAGWFPSPAAVCATITMDMSNAKWGTANGIIALWSVRQNRWIAMDRPYPVMMYICTRGA